MNLVHELTCAKELTDWNGVDLDCFLQEGFHDIPPMLRIDVMDDKNYPWLTKWYVYPNDTPQSNLDVLRTIKMDLFSSRNEIYQNFVKFINDEKDDLKRVRYLTRCVQSVEQFLKAFDTQLIEVERKFVKLLS